MYEVKRTGKFNKDLKRDKKRKRDIPLLLSIVKDLAAGKELDRRHCDHQLHGKHKGRRECHINPDWLLVYQVDDEAQIIHLVGTGTHSDLF